MTEVKEPKGVSVQLARNEKIVKTFNYASFGYNRKINALETTKRLVVTNKRIIHEAVCEERGNEQIFRREMPVAAAKYINTVISKKSEIKYLILAIVFGILTLLSAILALVNDALLFWIVAGITLIVSTVNLVLYYVRRSVLVSCEIGTDHSITSAMSFLSYADNTSTDERSNKNIPSLKVYVSAEVAQKLANELGAAILDATSNNATVNHR